MSIDPVSFAGNRLRFLGFSSGLDIDAIVSQLMAVERIPLDRLEQRRQLLLWTKEEYLGINRMLDQLRQALTPLKLSSTFRARTAESSDASVATATVSPGAAEGAYSLTVRRLAAGIQIASGGPITLSPTGDRSSLRAQFGIDGSVGPTVTLELQVTDANGLASSKQFTFDLDNDDIYDVVSAINDSGLGLTASYDAGVDRLFVSSQETGARVGLAVTQDATVTVGGTAKQLWADLFRLPGTASGQDAEFDLGGAAGLTSSTNQVTIAGVTYNLKGPGTTTITVLQDTDSIMAAIQSFVDQYNAVLAKINGEVSERRLYDYPPLTDAQKKELTEDEIAQWEEKARQGLLQGDGLLIGIASRMRRDVSDPVEGTGSVYQTLSSIGITTGLYFEGGRLYVDKARLREALTTDPEGVAALFTASGSTQGGQGVAIRLGATLDDAIRRIRERAGVTGFEEDDSGIGRQVRLLNDQMERLEARLAEAEARYYHQFALMEQVLAQMGAQAAWLSQQFMGAQG